jgi:hypothetical protein
MEKKGKKRGRPAKHKSAEVAQQKLNEEAPEKEVRTSEVQGIRKDAPATNYFVLCNGQPVKNVKELADALDELEDHVFNHHVQPDHNDFATWVKDIFQDVELAQKLADVKDRKHMQLVLYKHMDFALAVLIISDGR